MSRNDALMVAVAHVPGGSLDIILASVVLKLGIISPEMFVAIVSGALVSAVLVGPMLSLVIRLKKAFDVRTYFPSTAIISALSARNRFEALAELSERAAQILGVDPDLVTDVVRKREEIMSTGLGQGLAIPHGKIPGIEKPVIVFARSPQGLEWDSADGQPVHLVFLIITPESNSDLQVQILALIAKAMLNPVLSKVLMRAVTIPQIHDILVYELSKNTGSPDE
jgi:mannitol/fructose-specific phosphotransferase system IIA component (Ntr-type)